nr:hypothetical protein [Tanacetum cinerariifolium]
GSVRKQNPWFRKLFFFFHRSIQRVLFWSFDYEVTQKERLRNYPCLGTFGTVSATADTTAALSITLTSASIITHISVDDYEATGINDQAAANENVAGESTNPFPIVDDVELVVPQ